MKDLYRILVNQNEKEVDNNISLKLSKDIYFDTWKSLHNPIYWMLNKELKITDYCILSIR